MLSREACAQYADGCNSRDGNDNFEYVNYIYCRFFHFVVYHSDFVNYAVTTGVAVIAVGIRGIIMVNHCLEAVIFGGVCGS